MEYNTALFGEKRSVYTTVDGTEIRQFDIASQNISVQQGYDSGDFLPNTILPADLRLWEIGEESVLTKLSWYQNIDNVYSQWDSTDNRRVPMILSTAHVKTSSPVFDVQPTGSSYSLSSQCNYRNLITASSVKPDAQYPVWYLQAPILTGTAPHFNVSPFILDFNYAGVLALIYVKTPTNTFTLKNYIDNNNNGSVIVEVFIDFYYGDETHKIQSAYNHLEGGASTQAYDLIGGCIINSKSYSIPSEIKSKINYALDEIQLASRLQSQTVDSYARQYPLISCMTPTSSLRCSVFKDGEHLDNNGHLIQHGDGVYNDDDFAWILKQVALLGFWFTTDSTNITTRVTGENCTDSNTYLPEIKSGITTGRYWAGREAANQEAAKMGDDWREKINYQPGGGGSSEEGDSSSRATYETTLPSFGNIYFRNLDMIKYLAEDLNELITDTQNPYDPSIFYGQNPVDCIIAIKEYPIDITPYIAYAGSPNPETLMNIKLGRWDSNTFAYRVQIKTGGEPFAQVSLSIPSGFKTIGYEFLDYEPYSSYHLYLPFCGTVKIPSELAVETNIEVLYYADILSGACIAHIYINNKYYSSAQGQLAVDIPFSGYQVAQYTMNMLNASYAQKQAYANLASDVGRLLTGTGGSVIGMGINSKVGYGSSNPITITNPMNPADVLFSGTAGGMVAAGQVLSGAGKAIQAGAAMASHYETIKYNKTILNHSAPAPIKSSLGGGIINWESPYYVEMLVERPTFMQGFDSDKYTQLVGKACHIADTLANHSGGYVEAINCNLSGFPATQPEKVELAKLLADGVFL